MGVVVSLILIALGAILTFAVTGEAEGVDLDVVGIILMIAGVIGIAVDLAIFAPRRRGVAEPGYGTTTHTRTLVDP